MDKDEFNRIVRLFYDDVKRVAFVGCKDMYDAEDITQTAFIKLFRTSKTFETDAHIKNWLLRVAINESRSLWRSPWKTKVSFDIPENISQGRNESVKQSDVFDAILSLKPKNREVVHLFYFEEYSAKEIAEMLGISENTVFKRLQRGRDQIEEYILRKKESKGDKTDE